MKYYRKLIGKKCYLSPVSEEDADQYCQWLNDWEVTQNTLVFRQQLSLSKEEDILKEMITSCAAAFAIVDIQTDKLIGNCSLFNIEKLNRKAELGIIIGDKSYWNRGYGTEATQLLLDYGFNILNLHNIMLEVFSFNKRAIASYQKVGFKFIGKRREALIMGGKKYDEIMMDILSTEFTSPFLKVNFNKLNPKNNKKDKNEN